MVDFSSREKFEKTQRLIWKKIAEHPEIDGHVRYDIQTALDILINMREAFVKQTTDMTSEEEMVVCNFVKESFYQHLFISLIEIMNRLADEIEKHKPKNRN